MQYTILYNKALMMPFEKANELFEEYCKTIGFEKFAEGQKILDLLMIKGDIVNRLKSEVIQDAAFAYTFMSMEKSYMADCAFENMKKYPMVIWVEALRFLDSDRIMVLLENYHKELTPALLVMFITNLDSNFQLKAFEKYHKYISKKVEVLDKLYCSVDEEVRKKILEYYPNNFYENILLVAEDLNEDEALAFLLENKNIVLKLDADLVMEFLLLKISTVTNIKKIMDSFKEIIDECSQERFELFFTRYKYLTQYRNYEYDDDDDDKKNLTDLDLFNLFKSNFHKIGIQRTFSLFDNINYYGVNDFSVEIVFNLLDIAYRDCDISDYVNEDTLEEMIKRFTKMCRDKNYTYEEFYKLVKRVGLEEKLIFDDYIEAIVACGKLMEEGVINDKNSLFLELREKFSSDLINRSIKDGTYTGDVSLNGVFYRLAKGSIPFEKVYMTKKFKGLVYLTKCGQRVDNADYITNFLTDEQLVKLNISPVLKWDNTITRKNAGADNLSFKERMGLQLLCYFGKDKGKYLLESNMQGNLMENLFDGLNYRDIKINDHGTPIVNQELINFLFGYGRVNEPNSIINKMIRGELPDFKKYFSDFCCEYFNVKESCNGILSVKRIIKYFEDVDLAISLKPDELKFKRALLEMNTVSEDKLNAAVQLCKDARDREYSTIPKVAGKLGKFEYEILDLDNPLAVAVGNMSNCCFVVDGISYSSLRHSMRSKNGRTFIVRYDGKFLAQSWVWRNGDVICFDSVEAGCPVHGIRSDDIKLVDVYKEVADSMINISKSNEDEIQRVKVVTVGKSDYIFDNLEKFQGNVPKPLEKNVYVYDSITQRILAGSVPDNIRYGEVGAKYYDERCKPIIIDDFDTQSIDKLDEAILNINALRYRNFGIEEPIDFTNYLKIYSGDGWYILVDLEGNIESGQIKKDESTEKEYNKFMKKFEDRVLKDKQFCKKFNINS